VPLQEENDIVYQHILIPTDGSTLSKKAVKEGVRFARAIGAKVTFFHAPVEFEPALYGEYFPPDLLTQGEFEKRAKRAAERILGEAAKVAAAAGVEAATASKSSPAPWEAIVAAAKRRKCDLIFMASHGRRGLAGLLLGSETSKVLTHSKVPVLVYR
jgi:nucleotide-binding universal stress UspA family protein